jgi:uncharacterized protein (DUF1810 family)
VAVPTMNNFNLDRFTTAQEQVYPRVLCELKGGRKESHWMWFIFPQIDGLGNSSTAKHYSIKNMEEAMAYLAHQVLGERLVACSLILLGMENKSANDIFGFPDYLKLQSCMTLFSIATPGESVFASVLIKYFKNIKDQQTIAILNRSTPDDSSQYA